VVVVLLSLIFSLRFCAGVTTISERILTKGRIAKIRAKHSLALAFNRAANPSENAAVGREST